VVSFPRVSPPKPLHPSNLPHKFYMLIPLFYSRFDHPNNIG
jgi:hypothetical protein